MDADPRALPLLVDRPTMPLQVTLNGRSVRLLVEPRETLAEVKILGGLLPICAGCKKIRDDQGYWNQVEVYIQKHTNAKFTHGMCPVCIKKYYPGLNQS